MFPKELIQYRHLLREIVAKNIKIQYRNSILGLLWTLLQPLLTTLVLVLIFGYVFGRANNPKDIVNFPIYLLCGRLLYEFFSQSTKRAMRSINASASVIKKVRVPKYIYPLSNILSNFITFMISLIVLVLFSVYFFLLNDPKNPPPHLTGYLILIPIPLIILFILSTGTGLILSTLSVFFKDVENLYDVFCLLLFYATPIFYAPDRLGNNTFMLRFIMANPLYSIVEMFRDCVLRGRMLNFHHLWYSFLFSIIILGIGILFFNKKQDKFILYI